MSDSLKNDFKLPPEQQAIRDKCFHPSGTFVEFPIEDVETSIPMRFEKIVRQYPGRIAVKMGDQSVTYDELNKAANRIAHALIAERGKQTESVALLINTSISLVASMLGVLKSGKFFVLLDPSLPLARLTINLEEAGSAIVLADSRTVGLAKQARSDRCLVMELEANSADLSVTDLHVTISADTLFSIAYTSGSTGQPKGVCQNHRNLLHNIMLRSHESRISYLDRISLLTSGTANSVHDILFPLLNGATLLPFDLRHEGVNRLVTWLTHEQVSLCWLSSPLFRKLCESLNGDEELSSLRFIRLRSDSVYKCDIDRFHDVFPHTCTLLIGLSSSETGIMRALYVGRAANSYDSDAIVGYPVHGKEILLLDDEGREVGSNQIGEIVVRSRFLSPGYWCRPDLTEAKFKLDPHDPERRLYFTGDLGLMRADGCLIHKGRKDFRVKIRGYGVEVGEVEKALRECVDIQDAVVVTESKASGEARLIAYLTSQVRPRPTITQIRRMLKTKLPDYMIPSSFVILDALPLGPSGKVDRRALPDPGNRRPELDTPFIAPRTDLEKAVARIFTECTGIGPVGIEDNFFDLGGDSILLARLASRLSTTFHHELAVGELFNRPSVAEIARSLESPAQSIPPKVEIIRSAAASGIPNQPSFAQQRLWFLDQLNPEDPAYNLLSAFQISGELNIPALEQSLNAIIARHEVLRTVFESVDGQPRLKVLANVTISLNIVDVGKRKSVLEDEAVLRRFCTDLAQQPFDLNHGPLLRVTLLRRGDGDYVLLFAVHHIVFDGWSMGVLWSELSACYEAFCEGKRVSLPKLAIQYADYAHWQRDRLQDHRLQKQSEFWRRQLDGTRPLPLLTDRPRPPVQSSRGAKQSIALSVDLSAMLKRLSHDRGTTLFMTLLAAFQVLLHRYTLQDDIAIGCPFAGRNRPEVENLIGFFLNVLIFRVDISGEPNFLEFLSRVRQVCLAAYAHQDLPFEKLVEELHPERHLSRNPLVDVAFTFQNSPHVAPQLDGTSVSEIDIDSGISRFDLQLFLEAYGGQLRGHFSYNTDLFDEATIARMAEHFCNLVASIVANPEQRVSELPLLSEAEKHQLLAEWNDTNTDYPKAKCVHGLFEEQVERTPDAIAVVCEDQQLSYRELNTKANRLAHYLQGAGVGPDVLVAICMERCVETIVGLLAVLKAGGAYVPLDPSYPKERLGFMLQDSAALALITKQEYAGVFIDYKGSIISLDTDWEKIDQRSESDLAVETSSDNLAYVIYTSGSTGQPKGVAVSHRATNRLVMNTDYARLTSADAVAQASNVSFDAATFEIWGALLNGARLVVVDKKTLLSAQGFSGAIERHGITTLFLTTALFNQMVEQVPAVLGKLRNLLFGGETVDSQRVRDLLHKGPPTRLLHVYGPTETTTFASWYEVNAVAADATTIPIGRPIANTKIYVLDGHLNPVPAGVSGELYIGGPGVARGYLNRPELTAAKFLCDPFNNDPEARLYRTGDLARYLADGNIEFLGRMDNQVKIRGFRIELGEIESVLAQHPAVQQAVVLTREDAPGDKRLVAYVVGATGAAPTINELRSFLKQKLPEYMVPSAYVFLGSLPLTPNGKLDRNALPEPDRSRPELDESFAAPRTPVEEILSNIWAGILKLDKVGIDDNFFQLGGHSLLATQVISRINDVFATDVQLRRLFETPTIVGLAASIDAYLVAKNDTQKIPPIVPRAQTCDAPLSFAQQRLWFLDRLDPDSATYNVPAAFRLAGKLDARALEQSFNEIIRRHEALRTVFTTVNGEPAQTVLPPSPVALTCTDISDRLEKERELILPGLVREEARKPFDLNGGPLLRTKLICLAPYDHILCLNMHHIVSDGWSMGVLFRELSELYQAYGSGKPSSLPELSVQYADYSVWQRQWLQGGELDRQLSYWRNQLDGISPLQLPTDRTRPRVQTYRGSRATFELSAPLSQALKALSQQQGVTLFMTLLAAFQLLLSRYCGQTDIAVGTPIAGRTRHETERLIGFFVNTLVLRTDLSANPTFTELLRQVRETTLDAYSHQDLPFEKLVEELHPERNLSYSPLFQVMFAFQNNADQPLEFEGLTVQPIRMASDIAKFNLTLTLSEKSGTVGGSLNYNADLFDASTIERMLGHFQNLLEGIVTHPEQRISELPLLSEAEKHQLLAEWNDTNTDYPKAKCVHGLFEEQVERTPDATALVFEDQQLSYRELNTKANRLAHYLRKLGVGPEVLVGICVERSMEMVVGLLGILKAGGAYIPLDQSYPAERLEFVLADAGVAVLLTQTGLFDDREVCPNDSDRGFSVLDRRLQRIFLDRDWQLIARESEANPENSPRADNLAYVIYTSGSTGQPKGVAIEHRDTAAFLAWVHNAFSKEDLSGVLASTSLCFDLSVFEIFAPLSCGGTVILVENALALATISTAARVSLVNTVPSAMTELLDLDAIPPSVRVINLAGEPLRSELVRGIYVSTAVRKVHDLYGPTECTTYSTWICRSADGPQSIGRPIANTQIYILDAHRNPVPIGVAGEIYIGGDGVARGYLNRPELTAEKFIYHSFDGEPARRLYKTGDLARYLPDGNIEFLGRVDNQVKIRGYRIELGEIEAALGQDPWIQDAVVIARGDLSADKQLVAYVVPKRQTINSPEDSSWAELQEKQVSEWQTLFEQTFTEAGEPKDPTTNTAGVNSSYTNAPIPAAESRDWVDHAAKRIHSLNPNRVLDIGCGLGRTLFRIAPHCTRYWGADFSQAALGYVEQHLHLLGNKRAEIKLIQANADDLSEIPARYFDTVVINGVTQYFPHIEHLVKVLEGALNAVEPGGVIFVGDVRSLPLLEPFQLSVELFRASDDVPAERLWQTVKRNVAQEEELVVDPVFFSAICHRLTKIDRADILLKRGWAENELTRFRYDVILYVKPQEQPRLAAAWLDWSKENLTLSSVRELLKSGEPRTLGIARVPNARVLPEYRAAASLARGGRIETARALRDAIETMRAEALHPECFWALQNDLPYWVDLTWSNTGGPECFDVFFQRRDLAVSRHPPAGFQKEQVSVKSWHMYAHNPTEAKRNRLLGSFLRSHLKKKVPDYMIPSAFVVLDALPLTPNGKIERKALPAPDGWWSELDTAFIVPSTPIEEIIATIWKEVLGIQRVGIHDNFFDLGGHSLLATQVVARMRRVFQSEIPLRDLFEFPTIAELAATISRSEDNQTPNPKEMEHLLVEIEAMSDDEAEKLLAVDGVRS